MRYLYCDDVDEIQKRVIHDLLNEGIITKPRGMEIRELCGYCIHLSNPRNRLIYNPARKYSLTFALGEFLWYVSGREDLDMIQYYNRRYGNFSDDGEKLNGAYGKRIFGRDNKKSQFENVFNKLKNDHDTRQAVISIYDSRDLDIESRDIPCTCMIQYFIRNNKLNCIVYMRANDIIWGTAYDIFSFTMFQEMLANLLRVELGCYEHFVGSMHIYSDFIELGKEMMNSTGFKKYTMEKMPIEFTQDLHTLLHNEESLRMDKSGYQKIENVYFQELSRVLEYVAARKKGKHMLADDLLDSFPVQYVDFFVKSS